MYRYSINGTPVNPLNAGAHKFNYELINNSGFVYDKQIDEPFLFSYTDSFDFKAQESSDLCEELLFKIERKCGGVWAIWWEGTFAITEGNFDDRRCVYTILPRIKTFMFDDLEINLFDVPNATTVNNGLSGGASRTYVNGRQFDQVLLYLAVKGNKNISGLVSNFFQINPTIVSSDCIPGVPNYYLHMAVFALSDIQEPIPSDLATREYMTLKKVMDDLRVIFNVHWFVDSNYVFRVEHEIFFNGTSGLDFTLPEYEKYLKGKTKYNYDLKEFPKKETWKIADNPYRLSLNYAGLNSIGKREGEKTYQTQTIRTFYGVNSILGGTSQSEGLFLCATDGFGVISIGPLDTNFLVKNLHCYNRPGLYAILEHTIKKQVVESGGFVLQSLVRGKIGEEFMVPLCCGDTFNAEDLITTPLGVGKVVKASFNQKTSMLSAILRYPVLNCDDFDPSTILGMQVWLKHGVGITHHGGGFSTEVFEWADQSGNGNHFQNPIPSESPQYIAGAPMFFDAFPSPAIGRGLGCINAIQIFPGKRGTIITLLGHDTTNIYGFGLDDPSFGAGPLAVGGGLKGISIISTNLSGPNTTDFDLSLDGQLYSSQNLAVTLFPQNGTTTNYSNNALGMNGLFAIRRGADTSLYTDQNGLKSVNNNLTIPNSIPATNYLNLGWNSNLINQSGHFYLNEVMIFDRELTDQELEIITFYFIKQGYFPTFLS